VLLFADAESRKHGTPLGVRMQIVLQVGARVEYCPNRLLRRRPEVTKAERKQLNCAKLLHAIHLVLSPPFVLLDQPAGMGHVRHAMLLPDSVGACFLIKS